MLFCWPRQEPASRMQSAGPSSALKHRFPCQRRLGTDVTQFILGTEASVPVLLVHLSTNLNPTGNSCLNEDSTQVMQQVHNFVVRVLEEVKLRKQ